MEVMVLGEGANQRWWELWAQPLSAYVLLIQLAADARIGGSEFEVLFGQLYRDETIDWPIEVLDVLERLYLDLVKFSDADVTSDEARNINEMELRARAADAFERLVALRSAEASLDDDGSVALAQ
jgi:hypothetical protein